MDLGCVYMNGLWKHLQRVIRSTEISLVSWVGGNRNDQYGMFYRIRDMTEGVSTVAGDKVGVSAPAAPPETNALSLLKPDANSVWVRLGWDMELKRISTDALFMMRCSGFWGF